MRTIFLTVAFLMVVLVAASCGQKQVEQVLTTAPFFTTLEEAKAIAAGNGKNILVDFYTDW